MEKIFNELKIGHLQFQLAADLKLDRICLGIQGGNPSYPCIYCEKKYPFEDQEPAPLRTLGSLRQNCQDFETPAAAGSKKKEAKECKSVVNMPLFSGDNNVRILDLIPPPELHIFTGITTKIFSVLNVQWSAQTGVKDAGLQWAAAHGASADWQGGFNGNKCSTLLSKLDDLENSVPSNLKMFVTALRDFKKVKDGCFGQTLDEWFECYISDFRRSFKALKMKETHKVHTLLDHVADFCNERFEPLGRYSEQASESVHADFKKVYANYARDPNHPEFVPQLLNAILKYNSLHL